MNMPFGNWQLQIRMCWSAWRWRTGDDWAKAICLLLSAMYAYCTKAANRLVHHCFTTCFEDTVHSTGSGARPPWLIPVQLPDYI